MLENIQKTKILYVITKSNWGGAQRYVYDLAKSLPKESFECAVILGGDGELKTELEKKSIRTISLASLGRDVKLKQDIASFFNLVKLFRKEKPDVVHLNSSKIGGLGALASRLAGVKKIIFTAHGFAFNEERSALSELAIKAVTWLTLALSTQTITLSEKEELQAKRFPFVKNKITRIPNGIEKPAFIPRDEARRILADLVKQPEDFFVGKNIIGTIAELTPNKGLVYAVEAMQEINDSILVIIGEGEERKKIEQMIEEKKLQSKVFLAGFLNRASCFLEAFDIFILPSLKEGLPYVLFEAGSASLPTIATRVGGVSEIIESEKSGIIIRPKSSKEIMMAMRFLSENPEKKNIFGANLKKRIEEKFSLDTMLQKTLELYK